MQAFFRQVIAGFRQVSPNIKNLVLAQLSLQLINSSFFLLLNFFLEKEGYADYEIASFISYRFFAVMLLAAPLGFFIKGKPLRPFFKIASITLPILSFCILYAADHHLDSFLKISFVFWGVALVFMQVTALPYILLNSKPAQHSESISLFFSTWSLAIFLTGILNYLLTRINSDFFTEKLVLQLFIFGGFASVYFISRMNDEETISESFWAKSDGNSSLMGRLKHMLGQYEWSLIFQAVIPTLIIAIGAGFTIPVINLFFLNVHGVQSATFSMMGALTYGLVAIGVTFMPYIRRNYGYHTAITLFQSLAVIVLLILATTEYYAEWEYAVYIAIFFYLIRQPLMNVAGPMTSELTMYYVGEKNQELISAINASIWSGSWFISMSIFSWLRSQEWRYVSIFLITVILYVIGVIWYAWLIQRFNKRESLKNDLEGKS